ncbi:MAG TPA: hypothetical protein VK985_03755 [Rariglobus sp.]|nr:hypothetical protein [Rariglobus sp.]
MNTVSRTRFLRSAAIFILAVVTTAVPVRATLLVYEGFNGYTTGALAGQTPNNNTVGLDTAVGYYDDGVSTTRTLNYSVQNTGLTFGSLTTSGGALSFTAGTNVIGADLGVTFTGTLWSSYLINLSARGSASNDGALIRIGLKPSDSTGGHFNSWADSRPTTASTTVSVGYNATTLASTNGTASLSLNTTYIIISSFTNVGTPLSAGTTGVAKLWALTASQYAAFLSAGGDETALAGTSVTATATQTITSGTFTFSTSDAFALVTVNDAGVVDELRYGSALADVTPTPIPEPAATAAIMGIGCGLFFLRRREMRRR